MGEAACDLLDAELALDRLDAELASELPAHVRAFAAAYAAGQPGPPAPAAMRRAGALATARRALAHPVLADRALAWLRVVVPIAIDEGVQIPRERTWPAYAALVAARDAVAQARFGRDHIAVLHTVHGSASSAAQLGDDRADAAAGEELVRAWLAPCEPIGRAMLERVWRDLADRHGARGACRIVQADVRPRAFVVEPLREVTIVVGPLTTPVARFRALHELGHAIAALTVGALPRVLDEAVASYIARLIEVEGALDLAWYTPLAASARERRRVLAAQLDAIERGGPPTGERPPWALLHDPGAQAAYVAAEAFADRWWAELGPNPDPGALAKLVSADRTRIDATTQL